MQDKDKNDKNDNEVFNVELADDDQSPDDVTFAAIYFETDTDTDITKLPVLGYQLFNEEDIVIISPNSPIFSTESNGRSDVLYNSGPVASMLIILNPVSIDNKRKPGFQYMAIRPNSTGEYSIHQTSTAVIVCESDLQLANNLFEVGQLIVLPEGSNFNYVGSSKILATTMEHELVINSLILDQDGKYVYALKGFYEQNDNSDMGRNHKGLIQVEESWLKLNIDVDNND